MNLVFNSRLLFLLALLFIIPTAQAAMTDIKQARQQIDVFMAREDVRNSMEMMGISPDEAAARTSALSDTEAIQFAEHIETAPAGKGLISLIQDLIMLIANLFANIFDKIL